MKRFLAAVDLSPGAGHVLRATLELAALTDSTVSLLNVIEGAGEMPESDEALVSLAQAKLRELVPRDVAPRVESVRGRTGTVAWREICDAAQDDQVDLVVLGARHHGPLERALGTTAARVVNHCDRSVLVVRRWAGPPRRILAALDDCVQAARVRDYAVSLARSTRGKVQLFRAFDMPPVVPADMLAQYPSIDDAVDAAAAKALESHLRLVPPELRDGIAARRGASTWREICTAARDYDADLIVVGARGHGLSERLLGSTASDVVNHAECSVLVVRQPWHP